VACVGVDCFVNVPQFTVFTVYSVLAVWRVAETLE
jgi:hypothetical protein